MPIQQSSTLYLHTRKSDRSRKPPLWMTNFVTLGVQETPYAMPNYLSYQKLASQYQALSHPFFTNSKEIIV